MPRQPFQKWPHSLIVVEVMREAGFDEKQAVVLATAIPDVERPLADLRNELRAKMDLQFEQTQTRFAGLETQIAQQRLQSTLSTVAIIATMIALAAALGDWFEKARDALSFIPGLFS